MDAQMIPSKWMIIGISIGAPPIALIVLSLWRILSIYTLLPASYFNYEMLCFADRITPHIPLLAAMGLSGILLMWIGLDY